MLETLLQSKGRHSAEMLRGVFVDMPDNGGQPPFGQTTEGLECAQVAVHICARPGIIHHRHLVQVIYKESSVD